MATYLEQSMEKIKEFEGVVPWMYLDTVGKVTVGVGLMLVNEIAAHALPFLNGDKAATAEEIASEFLRVSAMKKGQLAKFYVTSKALRLPADAIDEKLRSALLGFEGYLRSYLHGYDSFPDAAKLALLDMVYNLGPGRLFAEYPRLIAAVERSDWRAAAAISARRGPSATRNTWTQQQFLNAGASIAVKAEAEELAVGRLLLGLFSGLAAAAALAIMAGELDRLATWSRSRPRQ